jgi:hypothetical protein
VIRQIDGQCVLTGMHWGLIPHWSKDKKIAYKTINARAETVAIKPAFRSAYKARRCQYRSHMRDQDQYSLGYGSIDRMWRLVMCGQPRRQQVIFRRELTRRSDTQLDRSARRMKLVRQIT